MVETLAIAGAVLYVTGGQVRGVTANGVTSFKGLPFAAPPTGELRWKAPQRVNPWKGVLKADAFAPACPQNADIAAMTGAHVETSEDCLYLNVLTPAKSADERLPVMVWIYGGGFAGGMTSLPLTDGTKLAEKGVVVVSVAYRVGPFGFLAHPELSRESGTGSGTYGLQDQIAGLRWVRDNIAKFGGDPGRVTVFGESAGGVSVSMLAASPAAKGLFQRAISESGGSLAPPKVAAEGGQHVWSLAVAEAFGKRFLESLGATDLKAARELRVAAIQKAADAHGIGAFWPVADGDVLPGDQYELYLAGRFNDTPVLIGTNSDEGAMFARPGVTRASFESEIRAGFGAQAESVLAAYPHATDAQAAKSTKDVFRDTAFAWNTWAWARLQSRKGKGKAFVYYFDQRTPASPDGADHGAELGYVFRNLGIFGGPPGPEDVALSDLMSSYWIQFAKTGDPNGPGRPSWPAFSEPAQPAMFFDAAASARTLPNLDKLEALERYYAWRREQAKKETRP